MQLYKGFSTFNRFRKYRVTDFELVKQDLYNSLHIRKGEKLMNPNYGTIIWNLLFEPYSDSVKDIVVTDLKRIVAGDPRLYLEAIDVTSVENGIMVGLTVRYKQTNEVANMQIMFDQSAAGQ